jgi:NAD(P)-dependent dehydrogenase (short-subunit alcohol dehydrogenase family)
MFTSHDERGRSAIIISASSDIGNAMSRRWLARGWNMFGTYRTKNQTVDELNSQGMGLIHCNLLSVKSIHDARSVLRALCPQWDVLALCPGTLDPIGTFAECNFDEWEESVKVNLISQMHIVHELLPFRCTNATVLFFAGGGVNNAPVNYSAYIVSKIALIKLCELLDAEMPDTRFVIIGPGWVLTKIHKQTLQAPMRAGATYWRTVEKLSGDECTPIDQVLDCCDWVVDAPRELISGRNFSVAFDMWGTEELAKRLVEEPDMYKLRRWGNDWLMRET